jgi:hypothetical protein
LWSESFQTGKPGVQARAFTTKRKGGSAMVQLVVRVVLTFVGTLSIRFTAKRHKR